MRKVGIVDDESLFREYLRTVIDWESCGYTVCMEASDGREALELAAKKLPDLLFADINMPVMDGLAMAKELKGSYPDMIIVIITGYSEFEYARRALRIGIEDFILKPFDREELLELLTALEGKLRSRKGMMAFGEVGEAFLMPQDASGHKRKERAMEIKDYINQHYMDSCLGTDKIASAMYMDASYLRRIFKEQFGMRISGYITKVRMEKAYGLLLEQNHSSQEVCEAIGFNDIHYFYKVFRKYFGVSPGLFRREKN